MNIKTIIAIIYLSLTVIASGCAESRYISPDDLVDEDAQNLIHAIQADQERASSITPNDPICNDVCDTNSIICSPNADNDRVTMNYNGIEYIVIEPDIVEIQTEAFGRVDFVPTLNINGPDYLAFFLVDSNTFVYRLPDSSLDSRFFISDSLTDFYYGDIDMDGLADIIIVAEYMPGTSPSPVKSGFAIYLQQQDGFINSSEFDDFVRCNVGWTEVVIDHTDHDRVIESYRVTCGAILEFLSAEEIQWDQYFPE